MAGMSIAGMQKILDTLTNKATYALPTLYAALTTTTPTASAAGTEITTGQYGGYARQALVGASWAGASAGSSAYNAVVDWGAASSSSGTNILGVEFWDSNSGGVRLWWEGLTSIAVTSGTHISFASGQFVASSALLSAGVGYATTYLNKFLDHMTGKTTATFYTTPISMYIALCSTHATATTQGTEATYTGYSATRVQLTTALVNATNASGQVVTNAQINFGACSAAPQTLTDFCVMDSATASAGNLVAAGTLANGVLSTGVTPDFPSASVMLQLT